MVWPLGMAMDARWTLRLLRDSCGSRPMRPLKIHALSMDKGGCHFYRLRTPLLALRARGHETSWGIQITGEELHSSDVLIVQFINGEQDMDFLRMVSSLKDRPTLVYEVDDDLFTLHEVVTPEVSGGKPVLWGAPDVQARVKEALSLVDLVTVTTPHLASMYAPDAKQVVVLPNSIPDWLLDVPVKQPDHFTIGWTCSHSHLLDAREFYPTFQRFLNKHTDARFHWVGPPKVYAFAPWQQKVTKWVSSPTEYLMSLGQHAFSVGIAPLGPFEFNKGKSGIKADEYSAMGWPTIASNFDQYKDVVVHGRTGMLYDKPSQWYSAFELFLRYPEEAVYRGAEAKELVSQRTISKTCHLWEDAYTEACDERS